MDFPALDLQLLSHIPARHRRASAHFCAFSSIPTDDPPPNSNPPPPRFIVGYQNKGFENSGYNIAGNTFLPIGKAASEMTLGDLVPNAEFVNSSIQFMTPGGANAKVMFGNKEVKAKYVYWAAGDDPEDGAGWYLDADGDAEVNQNELVTIPAGAGFLVSRFASEPDATVTLPSAL